MQVYPGNYKISATVLCDGACRSLDNVSSTFNCFPRRGGGLIPKLNDSVLGPLSNPPTEVAYILNGTSTSGNYERWIEFEFSGQFSMLHVILYYYCTGSLPQLKFDGGSDNTPLPSCVNITRQEMSFNVHVSTAGDIKTVILRANRNGGQFYLTEVHFYTEPPRPSKGMYIPLWYAASVVQDISVSTSI